MSTAVEVVVAASHVVTVRGEGAAAVDILRARGVTVLADDETLLPWRTVIHWPGIRWVDAPCGARTSPRWEVPVTCRCGARRYVYVVTSEPGQLSTEHLRTDDKPFTGLCRACVSRLYRLGTKLPDSSEVCLWDATELGTPVVCKCGTRQIAKFDDETNLSTFELACSHCGQNIGEMQHAKGARLLWLAYWLMRASERYAGVVKFPYRCAKCGEFGQTWTQHIKRKNWRGLCDEHNESVPLPQTITEDVHGVGPFKVSILYSRRKGNKIPIPCPLPACRATSKMNWFSLARTVGIQRDQIVGVCKTHTRAELLTLQEQDGASLASHGNGYENRNGQKIETKDGRGGAHNVKWTPEREKEYLTCYEEVLPKIKKKDSSIPAEMLAKLLLPGVQPSDVAREHAAKLLGVELNEYLATIITRARKRRKEQNAR